MLFQEKENLLSLYNALNKTTYADTDNLEITTLENAVYMNYKNDVSFVFDSRLLIYETPVHCQSKHAAARSYLCDQSAAGTD